jgi:hypothetical protein
MDELRQAQEKTSWYLATDIIELQSGLFAKSALSFTPSRKIF